MFGLVLDAHWWWLIFAVALAVGELLAPGIFLIWLAMAALATGIVTAATGVDTGPQLMVFAALAIVSVYIGRAVMKRHPTRTDDSTLNRRGESLVGETLVLIEPIVAGRGRVKVGDGQWTAEGPDLPAGTLVRVASAKGTTLRVEPAA